MRARARFVAFYTAQRLENTRHCLRGGATGPRARGARADPQTMTPGRRNDLTVLAAVASIAIFANGLRGYPNAARASDETTRRATWWWPSR